MGPGCLPPGHSHCRSSRSSVSSLARPVLADGGVHVRLAVSSGRLHGDAVRRRPTTRSLEVRFLPGLSTRSQIRAGFRSSWLTASDSVLPPYLAACGMTRTGPAAAAALEEDATGRS